MKAYYKSGFGKLYCGDCLEVMKEMASNSMDLVITDPPYGIKRNKQAMGKGGGVARHVEYETYDWDNEIPSKETFDAIIKISKNQIIFGGNYFIEYLFNSPCWIIWDKDNFGTDFADCEIAWTSFSSSIRLIKYRWAGMLQGNMKKKEKRYHPAQKPVPVIRWILEKYSEENDLIFDPFLGSGTTAVACEKLSRRWIGIEINEKYCEIAAKRIEIARAQLNLW